MPQWVSHVRRRLVLVVLATIAAGGCGSVMVGCGRGPATPPSAAEPEAAATPAPDAAAATRAVEYQIVARGGAGMPVEVDGKPVGVLDAKGELAITLEPRATCYQLQVRVGAKKTLGDCYLVEAASTSTGEAPRRQIIWDLAAEPR